MHALITHLPDHLAERARALGSDTVPAGDLVLYWLRTAARGHDNPALDVALTLADAFDRPLVVVQAIAASEPFASDRLHRFALEGAADVAAELEAAGIAYALHVERPGDDGPVLATLAGRAVAVVTEDLPTPHLRGEARALAAASPAPVLLVDTACILPMRLVRSRPERAFRFRKATEAARAERLALPWPPFAGRIVSALPADLPFAPVEPRTVDLEALVAASAIDHTVGPIADTVGGSRAGYARWAAFRDGALRRYASRRNDAVDRDGVSRMSAYLHLGHVSPFVVAREAQAVGGPGAEKFLDELLVWRELAHAWCFHTPEIETLAALPPWAQATLDAHRGDPRPRVFDIETLSRGKTGDALWDAAQTSLVVHGELHNNLRMTWGKALVGWSATPEQAQARLVELNHRYALDGRDPNSYGGLFWCLGLFDRPFEPPSQVVGTLRARPTASHAARLDLAAYRRRVDRPNGTAPRIAVIGAGLAGLVCARTLADHRLPVTVFEKSVGRGGRLATRRADEAAFDHGAQYFTARDPRFARLVAAWAERGLVARWQPGGREAAGGGDDWWVGVPGMSALGRHLAADLDVVDDTRITVLVPEAGAWRLIDEAGEGRGRFDLVVVAVPAPQAAALLAPLPALRERAAKAPMAPCWAGLFAFSEALPLAEVIRPEHPVLAWAARNTSKPGRPDGEAWVVHARPDWSAANLERAAADVLGDLRAALGAVAGGPLPEATFARAHRWRFALAAAPAGEPCLFDAAAGVAACGDWCLGGRIEAAYLSGAAAAGRILGRSPAAARAELSPARTSPAAASASWR